MTKQEFLDHYRELFQEKKMPTGDPTVFNTCPSCGYCPHCGRGHYAAPMYPLYPQPWVNPWPTQPYITWQVPMTAGTTAGTVSMGSITKYTNDPNITFTN